MIRTVIALGIAAVLAMGGCKEKPSEAEPETPGEVQEQPDGGVQPEQSAIPEEQAASESRPTWVDDPSSFYDPPRPDMILAVGTARIMAPGAETLARKVAAAAARANLSSAATSDRVERTVESMKGTSTAETTVRLTHSGTVRGVQELATWTSPDQVLYMLVGTQKPDAAGGGD